MDLFSLFILSVFHCEFNQSLLPRLELLFHPTYERYSFSGFAIFR
jgi:hypothetical protein